MVPSPVSLVTKVLREVAPPSIVSSYAPEIVRKFFEPWNRYGAPVHNSPRTIEAFTPVLNNEPPGGGNDLTPRTAGTISPAKEQDRDTSSWIRPAPDSSPGQRALGTGSCGLQVRDSSARHLGSIETWLP